MVLGYWLSALRSGSWSPHRSGITIFVPSHASTYIPMTEISSRDVRLELLWREKRRLHLPFGRPIKGRDHIKREAVTLSVTRHYRRQLAVLYNDCTESLQVRLAGLDRQMAWILILTTPFLPPHPHPHSHLPFCTRSIYLCRVVWVLKTSAYLRRSSSRYPHSWAPSCTAEPKRGLIPVEEMMQSTWKEFCSLTYLNFGEITLCWLTKQANFSV